MGVVLYDDTARAYALLAAVVAQLRSAGIAPAGLLQRPGERQSNGKLGLWLEDIGSGRLIRLDEPRGPGARSCVLDTDALAQGAWLLRQAIESAVRLIVVSRFGSAEAGGGGLRTEIADAICGGAAVLIPVRENRLADLQAFLGFSPPILPSAVDAITVWAQRAIPPGGMG